MTHVQPISKKNWYLLDRLPDQIVSYLWDQIEEAKKENVSHKKDLVGIIDSSLELKDPDNVLIDVVFHSLFHNPDLTPLFEAKLYENYRHTLSARKTHGLDIFPTMDDLWVNFQKKYEFNPLHDHSGTFSFVIWMKVPYHYKDEQKSPLALNSKGSDSVGNFAFISEDMTQYNINMEPDIEGCIAIFPSSLHHMVYPFYTSDEERVSISGNIYFDWK